MKKIFKEENIKEIAKNILERVSKGKKYGATIIALSGDLGAGKTTLTKEIGRILGIKENIVSPTFVIMKIYKTKNENFKKLIHIDAYRLDSYLELLKIGWEKIILEKENLIIIEWPENVLGDGITKHHKIEILHIDSMTRSIKF